MNRNIIDDQVLAAASTEELTLRTMALIPEARPNGLTICWAFGNACINVYREKVNPKWEEDPEAECYLEIFEVLDGGQVLRLHSCWHAQPTK